jgi:hypothetical protein
MTTTTTVVLYCAVPYITWATKSHNLDSIHSWVLNSASTIIKLLDPFSSLLPSPPSSTFFWISIYYIHTYTYPLPLHPFHPPPLTILPTPIFINPSPGSWTTHIAWHIINTIASISTLQWDQVACPLLQLRIISRPSLEKVHLQVPSRSSLCTAPPREPAQVLLQFTTTIMSHIQLVWTVDTSVCGRLVSDVA